ncbi:sugar ABC transporter permease [Clostridia bacterium]|nr:sugar ABC transporter permease [Clostridia bacterium]
MTANNAPAKPKRSNSELLLILIQKREVLLLIILMLLLGGVTARVPNYIGHNWLNILKGGSINMVMAAGMLPVLLIGSIDISVASVLALSGSVAGMMMRDGMIGNVFGMFVVGIGVGAVIGALNGALMAWGRVLPIIVTLGMSYIARALVPMGWLLGLNKIARIDLIDSFKVFMLDNTFLYLPYLVWIAIIVTLLAGVLLRYTRVGRSLYAVGSNESAALVRGVSTNRVKLLAHTICGAMAGLAGIMWLGYYNSVEKTTATGDEMYVIAACVLGGVSVTGGYGKITGVLIGAVMIAVINSAIPQLNIGNAMITEFIKGLLLLGTILLNVSLGWVMRKRELRQRNI